MYHFISNDLSNYCVSCVKMSNIFVLAIAMAVIVSLLVCLHSIICNQTITFQFWTGFIDKCFVFNFKTNVIIDEEIYYIHCILLYTVYILYIFNSLQITAWQHCCYQLHLINIKEIRLNCPGKIKKKGKNNINLRIGMIRTAVEQLSSYWKNSVKLLKCKVHCAA